MPGGMPIANISSLVPYTGATTDVDLGSHSITTTGTGTHAHLRNADEVLFIGTFGSGWTEPNLGAGTRFLWYPRKAAFRAGKVTGDEWNDANIGIYSFAVGEVTKANGVTSAAFGLITVASGENAVAMGDNTTASGTSSVAMGSCTVASGDNTFATGYSSQASGISATAFGQISNAEGNYAFAAGANAYAAGDACCAVGYYTAAYGIGSFACGVNDNVNSTSFAAGAEDSTAAIAIGYASVNKTLKAEGAAAIAIGQDVNALADNAIALGRRITNDTEKSFAVGFNAGAIDLFVTSDGYVDVRTGYKCGGTSPVDDGTYTVGAKLTGGGVNGTITVKGGIITAIQAAT